MAVFGGRPSAVATPLGRLSRRTMCFSIPADYPVVFLPGSRLRVGVSLPDLGLRTRVHARVDAVMEGVEHRLCGLSLFGSVEAITTENTARRCGRQPISSS